MADRSTRDSSLSLSGTPSQLIAIVNDAISAGEFTVFTLLRNTKSSGAITRLATMGFPMTHNSMWVLYYRVRAFSTSARQSQDTVIYLLSKTH